MRFAITILLILFFPAILSAKTIYVPTDYPRIQEAIDAAVKGDTVLVLPGTYEENIDFKGKAITLASTSGPDVTILDRYWTVVHCWNGEGPDTVLDGFTIRNGSGTEIGFDKYGGGMLNEHSSPTVNNCIFYDNSADQGGGMCNRNNSNPTVTNCTFIWNWVEFLNGGGMCNISSNPTVTNCTFLHNYTVKEYGGGMCNISSSPVVTDCIFIENEVGYMSGGGMCNRSNSNPTVTNCIFYKNEAHTCGGMSNIASNPTIINCTFYENSGVLSPGGIYNQNATPTLTNCILWKDTPQEILNSNSSPIISYCCIDGGYPGTGNISSDPLFVEPVDGDLHLTFRSPCKDTGDNTAVTGIHDFEGDPRIAYGTVDMGADEFYTHLYWTGDATPSGSVALKFVGLPWTTPVQLWLGSGVMDPPMHTKYGDWHLEFPLLFNATLGSIPNPDGILVIPITLPAGVPTPLTLPLQAGIGLELTNLSVMEVK